MSYSYKTKHEHTFHNYDQSYVLDVEGYDGAFTILNEHGGVLASLKVSDLSTMVELILKANSNWGSSAAAIQQVVTRIETITGNQ